MRRPGWLRPCCPPSSPSPCAACQVRAACVLSPTSADDFLETPPNPLCEKLGFLASVPLLRPPEASCCCGHRVWHGGRSGVVVLLWLAMQCSGFPATPEGGGVGRCS